MKKALCILLLAFFLFSVSFAQAAEWKTVRFPNEPNYVFMLPDSCYTVYYGMPDDSPILQDLGITAEYAERWLEVHYCSILIYPKDLSCTISIGRFEDKDGLNYSDIDPYDFLLYADQMCELFEESYKSSDSIFDFALIPSACGAYGTDSAQYVIVSSTQSIAEKSFCNTQAFTVLDGYQTILVFTSEENEHVEENLSLFFDIIDNLVIL